MFEKSIGGNIKQTLEKNEILAVLRRVHLFSNLSLAEIENLMSLLKMVSYQSGETVFKEGDPGDSFFIIKSGNVEIVKAGVILRTVTKNDFFGEKSILLNEKRTATVICKENSYFWVLNNRDFFNIIDPQIKKQLLKRIELQDDSISLNDLEHKKKIGFGMFGRVYLVHNTKTKANYALKSVSRPKISKYKIHENLVLERKILLQLDHPMIMKLVKTFKDEQQIYFLMELVQGLDLFDVMREVHLIDEQTSTFYISCLMLILSYLHENRIVYRDLKPENIMIDEAGYPKLIDFGTAKIIENRTYTVLGTPHYMAPEVINGTGYSIEADY